MNKSGYQINEKLCVVNSDSNSLMICSKENDKYTFEEILNKENELDMLYDKKKNNIKNVFRTNPLLRQAGSGLIALVSVDLLISSLNAEIAAASTIATELAALLYSIKMNKNNKYDRMKAKEELKNTNESIKNLEKFIKKMKEITNYNCEYNILSDIYQREIANDNYTEKQQLYVIKNYLKDYLTDILREEINNENELTLKRSKY